jgi:hypothetical protein
MPAWKSPGDGEHGLKVENPEHSNNLQYLRFRLRLAGCIQCLYPAQGKDDSLEFATPTPDILCGITHEQRTIIVKCNEYSFDGALVNQKSANILIEKSPHVPSWRTRASVPTPKLVKNEVFEVWLPPHTSGASLHQ